MSEEFQLEAPDPAKKKRAHRKKGKSAKQRSMELLRGDGYRVANAEYWNGFAGQLVDLFGFADLVALGDGRITAVQVTKGDLPRHIEKIRASENAQAWLECNGLIVIHHWRELGLRGQKKMVLDVIQVTADSDTHEVEPDFFEVKS